MVLYLDHLIEKQGLLGQWQDFNNGNTLFPLLGPTRADLTWVSPHSGALLTAV